ncbi:hypothetical protein L207DRAFT_544964 [Hyaloscypha variabilis F]|uniref:CID domain-containing protein n=1 Tax=Hyaloscypha variabilis (strain UAMH 11265 / GT02V1 / F) TaxID=1149755 RepID=A0A2J6RKG1_HYAVF|nr:hypothetical protein L207DRAFT_544964 [Hyaloscypha variabilis F]
MSYGQGPDDIAEDFKSALQDLSINSRFEISNLTIIAKENTEHAFAIAESLKLHIKQTPPQKKLPAFYVLDSIVKNVGTPYTLFFGRQLYATFMEAYALVDTSVRRKMDEMLKTWKEPVPGSMDPRPVFPPELTRPIENALIKAKTSFVQAHQEHLKNQQQQLNRVRSTASPATYRDTPTPPNAYRPPPPNVAPGYAPNYPPQQPYPPPMNGQQYSNQPNGQQPYGLPPRPPSQQYPPQVAAGPPSWQQPPSQGYQVAENSIARLNSDIDKLITTSKAEWAQNPYDNSIGTRLKALLDLQTILQNQQLPPDQIALIKDQVDQLSQASQAANKPQLPSTPVYPPVPVVVAQPPAQQPSLSSILGPSALAALARASATPQPVASMQAATQIRSPQPPYAQPYQPPPPSAPTATSAPEASSLLDRLRAAGMLPAVSTPTTTSTSSSSVPVPPVFPPPYLNTPPTASRTPLATLSNDVVLKPASLKERRPHLISGLYERLGAPCTQCGRRFQADEEGKKKKTAHMDWHFKVHQRMAEAEVRGQHRSWYVDELDWIKSREVEDESGNATTIANNSSAATTTANDPKLQYLAVPDDPALANSLCPICQEKFEMKWLDEAQEFVWMDAKKVGDRIYHASCYAEATKDVNTQIKRGTPEPAGVLGKRKAEASHSF